MIEVIALVLALFGGLLFWVILSSRRSMAFVFCNATISGWESKLLSEPRLMELAEAPSLTNLFTALEDTDYRASFGDNVKIDELEPAAIERGLKEGVNRRLRELAKLAPEQRKSTLLRLLQRTDLSNIKTIITMIHDGAPKEQRMQELTPSPTMSNERLEMLASADDLNRLLEFLKGSEYFNVISASLDDYQKRGLIAILAALDKAYYTQLWEDVQRGRDQRAVLRTMIGYEIDSLNIKLILRLKKDGVPSDEINGYLIRPAHELTEAMLKAMLTAEDTRSAVHMIHITTYGKILAGAMDQIEEQGMVAAERALDQGQLKAYRYYGLAQFFSIAPMISFVYLKENEMKNLRTIIRLKADGVEPQRIKEKIRRVPKLES